MNFPMITAHSGCEGITRDSIDSVIKGIELKAEAVEVDVRIAKNGVLRLSHDDRDDYSDAATLEDAFKIVADNDICINCDLKQSRTLFPVLDLADKCNVAPRKLIFSGDIDLKELAWHPEIAKRARIFLNAERVYGYYLIGKSGSPAEVLRSPESFFEGNSVAFLKEHSDWMINFYKQLGAECMNICYNKIDSEIVSLYASLDLPISVWTVNAPEMQKRFIDEKVLNITTTSPASALRIRDGK